MEFFESINFISNAFFIFGGGIGAFFIIRFQLRKSLEETVKVYKEELEVYKLKLDRLEGEVQLLRNANSDLKSKKNYMKQLLIEALQTKTDVKELLDKALKDH